MSHPTICPYCDKPIMVGSGAANRPSKLRHLKDCQGYKKFIKETLKLLADVKKTKRADR